MTYLFVCILLLLALGGPGIYGAVIVRFTNQTAWNATIPGGTPTWCVNFNYLTTDSRITNTARTFQDTTNTNRLVLATAGSSIPNDIDSFPFRFAGPVDNTTYAALWVDRDSNTTVVMTFTNTAGIRAWSASFLGIGTAEALQVNIRSTIANSTVVTEDVPNGFFGFTINEDLQSIRFTAKNPNGNASNGELFSMDNVCVYANGTTTPTPPTPTPPTPTPPVCIVNVPILGFIICFLSDLFNAIF